MNYGEQAGKGPERAASYGTVVAGLFSIKKVVLLLLLTGVICVGLSLYAWRWYGCFKTAENQNVRMIELNGVIMHFDEVLTMSAKMAAATGDLEWENRYRNFEPQLDAAIKEAMNLSSATFLIDENVTSTDAANIKLVAMENNAFDLVRQGNREAAMALLHSREYEEQKRIYSEGMSRFITTMQGHIRERLDEHRQTALGTAVFVGIATSLVVFVWFAVVQMRRRLLERKRAEEALRGQAHILKERVKEVNCLYGITRLVTELDRSMDGIFEEAVEWIRTSWQYPKITCARIVVQEHEFMTDNFEQTRWKQSADIIASGEKIGFVEVCYLQEKPVIDEGPFLKEERSLIDALGRQLGGIVEYKQAEQKQAELLEQVEEVNKELNDFAHIVSHELKAPLHGIKKLVEWLSADYADKLDGEGIEQMNLLSARADRMHNLIDGVLRYSRVGHSKEEQVQVNLSELVPEVIDMVTPSENITVTIEDQLPVIECGQTSIIQVFENLLSNAVKYMDKPEGKIKINCVRQDDFWKFSVADNGCGIAKEHFEKIFGIFQTLSPRDEIESTGVGLSVVKRIIDEYGGRIWVESRPGEGSTFFFTLPRQEMGVSYAKLGTDTAR